MSQNKSHLSNVREQTADIGLKDHSFQSGNQISYSFQFNYPLTERNKS